MVGWLERQKVNSGTEPSKWSLLTITEDVLLYGAVVTRTPRSHRVHRHTQNQAGIHRLHYVATRAEHNKAMVTTVSDDELVEGGARGTMGILQHSHADVADEVALHAEHAHAVVSSISDYDVPVTSSEAKPTRCVQFTVAAAFTPKATNNSAVATVEHTDAVLGSLGNYDDVGVRAHTSWTV